MYEVASQSTATLEGRCTKIARQVSIGQAKESGYGQNFVISKALLIRLHGLS